MLTTEGFMRPGRDTVQMKIKVLRGFYAPVGGAVSSVAVGEVIEVPKQLAQEVVAARKAEYYKAPAMTEPDLPPPVDDEVKPTRKGKKDVS